MEEIEKIKFGFTYPVAFGILRGESEKDFIKGSLIGISCVPIAIIIAALLCGYNMFKIIKLQYIRR